MEKQHHCIRNSCTELKTYQMCSVIAVFKNLIQPQSPPTNLLGNQSLLGLIFSSDILEHKEDKWCDCSRQVWVMPRWKQASATQVDTNQGKSLLCGPVFMNQMHSDNVVYNPLLTSMDFHPPSPPWGTCIYPFIP